MKKKILILSTSLRKGGNSEILTDEFMKGAQEVGHNIEKVCLYDKVIGFCRGCLVCQKTKNCVIKDDTGDIIEKMLHADVLVFATPIYFYEMCGQMKTLLDRSNPLFTADYNFRDIYLLATAADGNKSSIDGAIRGLQGWISCFEKAKLKDVIYGVGATDVGDICNNHNILKVAYDKGKNV